MAGTEVNFYTTDSTATSSDATWTIWTNGVWQSWVENDTTATVTVTTESTDNAWFYWSQTVEVRTYTSTQESDEIKAHRADRERERIAAEEKADSLLQEILTDEQRKEYREQKVIPITAKSGRRYRIAHGQVTQVDKQGAGIASYCIHPDSGFPISDVMLTQLCWLKWCEEEFLRTANASVIRQAA